MAGFLELLKRTGTVVQKNADATINSWLSQPLVPREQWIQQLTQEGHIKSGTVQAGHPLWIEVKGSDGGTYALPLPRDMSPEGQQALIKWAAPDMKEGGWAMMGPVKLNPEFTAKLAEVAPTDASGNKISFSDETTTMGLRPASGGSSSGDLAAEIAGGISQLDEGVVDAANSVGLGGLVGAPGGGLSGEGIENLREDVGAARDMRAGFIDEYGNFVPREAPTMEAADVDQTVLGPTSLASTVRLGPVTKVERTDLAPVERANAVLADRVSVGPADLAGVVDVDTAQQAELRGEQLAAIRQLRAQAEGTAGPTPEELMLRRGADRAANQQMGLATAVSRGGNIGLAARTAARNSAQIYGDMAGQAAEAAARNRQQAAGQLVQAVTGARGQDIGLSTDIAKIVQEGRQFDASQSNTVKIEDARLGQQTELQNADAGTRVGLANAGAVNNASTVQAQLDADAAKQDASSSNTINVRQGELAQQTILENQDARNEQILTQGKIDADRNARNAELEQQASTTNIDSTLKTRELDDAERSGLRNSSLNASQQAIAGSGDQLKAEAAAKGANMQLLGTLASAGGAAMAASDRSMKHSVHPASRETRSLLEILAKEGPKSFLYDDPDAPGASYGRQIGVMANDVEKSDLGDELVVKMAGKRALMSNPSVLLALIAEQQRQIDGLMEDR